MTIGSTPVCYYCKFYNREVGGICSAYPLGIPKQILYEAYDHRKPFYRDQGIRFEPNTPEDEKEVIESYGA